MLIQLIVAGLATGGTYALVGIALSVTFKGTNVLNFAQGEMAMLTTFLAYVLIVRTGIPYGVGVVIVLVVAGLFGYAIERFLTRPAGESLLVVGILTIGLYYIIDYVALQVFPYSATPQAFPSAFPAGLVHVFGAVVSIAQVGTLGVALVLMAGIGAFYRWAKLGVAMRAHADNPEAAAMMGIDHGRIASLSWMLASMIGSVAGLLLAPLFFIDVGFMQLVLMTAMSAAVMGGFISLPGVAIGGLLVGVAENLFGAYISANLQDLLVYGFILLVLMIRPQGLLVRRRIQKV